MKAICFAVVAGLAGLASADVYEAANLYSPAPTQARLLSVPVFGIQANVVAGDTFTAEGLVQDGVSAFFTDDGAGSVHTFGSSSLGGNNLTNPGTTSVINSVVVDNMNGTYTAAVSISHLDVAGGLGLWVAGGQTGPNGSFVSWRFDAGSNAGGADQINIDLGMGESINVLGSGIIAFNSAGASLGSFAMTLDSSSASALSGVGVIGLGGGNIAGFDLSGIELQWTYEVVPTPSSAALLGLGGLLAARRRR